MKLSRIKKLCKESKTITLTDKIDETGEILQFAGSDQRKAIMDDQGGSSDLRGVRAREG